MNPITSPSRTATSPTLGPRLTGLLVLAVAALLSGPVATVAALATSAPPEFMTYQGFVVDANNAPLGESTPVSYSVVFRIYETDTATTPVWSESQTVTFDEGRFSVLLGEGGSNGTEPHEALSSIFAAAGSSTRYIGLTVAGLGTGAEIKPRLRLVTSPYSFLARSANQLVGADGTVLVTANASGFLGLGKADASVRLDVDGDIKANNMSVSGGKFSGNGSGLTALNLTGATGSVDDARLSGNVAKLNATQVFTGTKNSFKEVATGDLTAKSVTSTNTLTAQRDLSVAGKATVAGTLKVDGSATIGGTVTAAGFAGAGAIPIGGIILWSGTSVPDGWALCDGNNGTPNLQGRFVMGASSTYPTNAKGGKDSVTLSTSHLPKHHHTYDDYVMWVNDSKISGRSLHGTTTGGATKGIGANTTDDTNDKLLYRKDQNTSDYPEGSPSAFSILPPYYALAYIQRIQ